MTTRLGPENVAEIRDDILTDLSLEAAKAGITENVEPGSDNYVWATGHAPALMLCHVRIDGAKDACTPVDAVGEDLLRWKTALRLPDLPPARAGGKIRLTVTGTASIVDGQPGTIKNQRFAVVGNYPSVTNGDEVTIRMETAGSAGNAKAGTPVVLIGQPANVSRDAVVSAYEPVQGGYDTETEERLRLRILNRTGTSPGGGNWGQLRQTALDTSPAVQDCFVYPAIGGPSTAKAVPVRAFDRELFSFSRVYPSSGLDLIRVAIHRLVSTAHTHPIQAAADETTDVSIQVTLPDSTLTGGNGQGWLDGAPWPQLFGGETKCTITSVSSAGVVTINAATTTSPIANQTRIAWWSPNSMEFIVRTVSAVSGSAGAWVVTPDAPFVDATGQTPAAGQYISPAAQNIGNYGKTWLSLMEQLGPGENTSDTALIANGRALRHPFVASGGKRYSLSGAQLKELERQHPEVEDAAYAYRSKSSPTVPATVEDAPNILVPRHFGIYPV